MKIYGMLIVTMLSMPGCASFNDKFDCPQNNGFSCKPLSTVNAMISRGELNKRSSSKKQLSPHRINGLGYPASSIAPNQPIRVKEMTIRVWLAPYEDSSGNYHEQNYIYTVVTPEYWIGKPVKIPALGDE